MKTKVYGGTWETSAMINTQTNASPSLMCDDEGGNERTVRTELVSDRIQAECSRKGYDRAQRELCTVRGVAQDEWG